ncbi:MAG TPA: cation:proton antiporter, partial [Methanocorpusculum sp.]|nr:cation:proton antiporter [Methanocorpusculum sp.]
MPSESELILAAVIVLACSVLIYFIGRKVRMPLLIGYFITGILAGPYGLGLISEDEVSLMADLGIILLMFTIGLGISLKKLLSMKRIVLIGGGLQLLLTISAVWAVLSGFGIDPKTSLLIGFFIGCSSSAIILNIYQKTGEIDKLHGRVSFGIAIFQDICVIPMMMIVPLLSGDSSASVTSLIFNFIFGMIILVLILAASVVIVPKFLQRIALTRNSELFIIAVVLICFGIAWLISLNGVSLALGAFIAGMAISESDYSQEVKGIIMPMRDLLTSFFFVSIGMMLNLEFLYKYLLFVVILALAVMIVKSIINFISIKLIGGIAAGAALISAVGISQIGEFSFILGSSAMSYGIIDENIYQILLAAAILTMALTPFAVSASSYAVPKILRNSDKAFSGDEYEDKPDNDHVIIVGFGPSGRYVANALKSINISYIVLETNSKTVTEEKKKGERIVFGDASREVILNFAGIKNASAVVITIPDMESTKAIISMARYMNPKISIITRSRFISEISNLYRLGADEVVVDEKEAAIQITRRILSNKQ